MAHPRTPRRAWIDEGLRALAVGGPEAVRVEALAQSLGVTKGGFYGYFADRSALLTEMLDVWEHEVTDRIVDRTEQSAGDDPRERRGVSSTSSTRQTTDLPPVSTSSSRSATGVSGIRMWHADCAESMRSTSVTSGSSSARSAPIQSRSRPGA